MLDFLRCQLFGLSTVASRHDELARRPRSAQPQTDAFRSPRRSKRRQESLPVFSRHEGEPAVRLSILTSPPFANCVARHSFQLCLNCGNPVRGLLSPLEILASA